METVSGNLASALKIEPGITAIIGSGGKSTLLKARGLELMRAGGRVLLCTTTRMFPVAGVPWDGSCSRLDAVPWKPGALHVPGCTCEACAGMSRGGICQAGVLDPETGKLSSPAAPLDQLEYGKSITDACVPWDRTEQLLHTLADAVDARRKLG